ncbi:MAG: FtsX-like permease family protein, partial [Oscillospiraceae bacterium]
MEDALSVRYPREIIVSKNNITDQQITEIDKVISNELAKLDVTAEDVNRLLSVELSTAKTDTRFDLVTENAEENDNNFVMAYFLSLDEYKKMGGKEELVNENDVLLYTEKGEFIGDKVQFGDAEFNVKSKLEELDIVQSNIGSILDSFYFIFKDDKAVLDAYKTFVGSDVTAPPYSYTNSFNLPENIDAETQIQLNDNINNAFNSLPETNETRHAFSSSKEDFRGDFLGVYGGLFFLGIFLGVLFLMATVLIIYYKQISEGYDDKERFEIMQKVGMSHSEVKKAIHSQVLTVFFLPLLAAGVHIAFAFKMITKLLAILSLTNIGLFALCMALTFIVFAVIYSIIYSLTAKAYYKIVQ